MTFCVKNISFIFKEMSAEMGLNGLNEFVIGGTPPHMNSRPYMISLQKSGSHYCGGALITAGKAISATHCYQSPSLVTAILEVIMLKE